MPAPDLSMTDEAVRALLAAPHIGVLSTLDPRGFPHSVGIYYYMYPERDELGMWVYGKSQKARNVEREPRASLLVESGEPYRDLQGVLVRGEARVLKDYDSVFDLGKQIYVRYFAGVTGIPFEEGGLAVVEKQSQKRVAIVLPMERIASWDHAKG